eukprot:9480099-Pyramimonas_sp.AAC.1
MSSAFPEDRGHLSRKARGPPRSPAASREGPLLRTSPPSLAAEECQRVLVHGSTSIRRGRRNQGRHKLCAVGAAEL